MVNPHLIGKECAQIILNQDRRSDRGIFCYLRAVPRPLR